MPDDRMTWSEVKRRWALMTEAEQEAVRAKQQWEHMSRLGVAHDWPSMFPNRTAAWQPAAWRCDSCGYVHPEPETPYRCPSCDVGQLGSWTGADVPEAVESTREQKP